MWRGYRPLPGRWVCSVMYMDKLQTPTYLTTHLKFICIQGNIRPRFFFCPLFSSLSADEFKTQKNQRSPIFSLLTQLHLGKLKTGQICKCRRVKEIQGYNNPVYSRWTDVPWYRPRAVVRAQLVAELMTLFWSPWSSVVLATLLAFRTSWAVALATALARASNVS